MEIFLRWPGGKTKALTLSYDDGVDDDLRLMQLMDENGVLGTFNVNSALFTPEGTVWPKEQFHRRMTKKQIVDAFRHSHHEVAVHTLTHPFLGKIPYANAMLEILEDRKNLEEIVEKPVRGLAYPYYGQTPEIVESLKNAHFLFARADDEDTLNFALPKNPLILQPTCHHDHPELMNLAKKFVEADVNKEHPFDPDPYLFYVWGHSYEFEYHDNWNVIEDFLKFIGHKEDVYYATNGDIFGYVEKWNRMEFTIDGRFAYNPTDTDLYLRYNGRDEMIQSGETKKLSLV